MLNKKIVVAAVGAVALMGAASSFSMGFSGSVGVDAGATLDSWTQSTSGGAVEKKNKFIFGANLGYDINNDVAVQLGFVKFADDQPNYDNKHYGVTLAAELHPMLNDKFGPVFQAGAAYHIVNNSTTSSAEYKKFGAVFKGGFRYMINSQISAQVLGQFYSPVNDDNQTRQYGVTGGISYALSM